MGFSFIPIYISYLGIEAYGLIGAFTILQVWLGLLDMGLAITLNREFAKFVAGSTKIQNIKNLLRSVEIITLFCAVLVVFIFSFSSKWLGDYWINAENISSQEIEILFILLSFIIALRFFEGIYRSALIGLQKLILFNLLSAAIATFRGLGAVVILIWISPTLEAFFVWQVAIAFIATVIFAAYVYSSMPRSNTTGVFSWIALHRIKGFAVGVLGMSVLSMLLTQLDKIMLSKILTLSEFGYYILATTVAGILNVMIGPIVQALFPRLCELHSRGDEITFLNIFHKSAQLVSITVGSVAIVIIVHADLFLRVWTQDDLLTSRIAPLLSILTIGTLLNCLMWIPFQLQMSHGSTRVIVYLNVVACILIIPSILWVTPIYGVEGAAWIWVLLNMGYFFIGSHFIFKVIVKKEMWRWYLQDVAAPIFTGFVGVYALSFFANPINLNMNIILQIIYLALTLAICIVLSFLSAGRIRRLFFNYILNRWDAK